MGISIERADWMFNWANLFLIASLVVGVVSTVAIVVAANVKEAALKRELAAASERTEEAKADAAKANARAAEAQLELAKFKAPRKLTSEQQMTILSKITHWAGLKVSFSTSPEPETIALMRVIRTLVISAGWVSSPNQTGDLMMDGAGVIAIDGIQIQVHGNEAKGTRIAGAANVLAKALSDEGIASTATINNELKDHDTINIAVGSKPK